MSKRKSGRLRPAAAASPGPLRQSASPRPLGAGRLALLGLIGVALAGLLAAAVAVSRPQEPARSATVPTSPGRPAPTAPGGAADGDQVFPLLPSPHLPEGTRVTTYNSDPPTSGPHWTQPAPWGASAEPLPDEQLVHNLEHGGIWISYRPDLDAETRAKLESFAGAYPRAVVLAPRPRNDRPIVLASWGRLQRMDAFDDGRMLAFLSANLNRSPEKLASLEQPALKVGQPFPDFTATEVDGRRITRESLRGKPAIVWFTTTYCVPCQIGARVVAKLDDELGGGAFDLVVIFVDPKEPPAALRDWRREFARPDWMVALDVELAKRVELRYLDTKYLLDRAGVIRNIDVAIADERYLGIIRQVVRESR